jgi:hypothetical protein
MKDSRGFETACEFKCTYGSTVRVKESSAASAPHIWLFVDNDLRVLSSSKPGSGAAHLTIKQARILARALFRACREHYQVRKA